MANQSALATTLSFDHCKKKLDVIGDWKKNQMTLWGESGDPELLSSKEVIFTAPASLITFSVALFPPKLQQLYVEIPFEII